MWPVIFSLCFSASVLTPLAICDRLYRDVQAILVAVRALPSDNVGSTGNQKPGELDDLLVLRFGAEPPS
jgi:hypothetical protein